MSLPNALSQDLRARVIKSYDAKEGSMRELAERFKVGWMTIWRWHKQHRLTGSLSPKPHRGGKQPLVHGETEQTFRTLLQTHPDSTLDELRGLFREKTGISLSRATTHRTCRRHGFTRKKKSAYAQERDRPDIKKNGKISRRNAQAGKAVGSFSWTNPECIVG